MAQAELSNSEISRLKSQVESYRKQSRWGDMAAIQLKILNSYERSVGKNDQNTISMMHDLANTYGRMGKLKDAAELYRSLVPIRQRLLGEEASLTVVTMHYLAVTLTDSRQFKEAEELHRKVLSIRRRTLRPEHPDTLRSMQYLAVTCGGLGKLAEARDLYETLLPLRRRELGTRNATTINMISNLANTYSDLGQFHEATGLHQELLDIRRESKGAEHQDTLKSMNHLAVALHNTGRIDESANIYAQVLDIQKRQLGPENAATLTTMSRLAIAYTEQKRFREAEEMHSVLLASRKRSLGADHKDTLNTAYYLSVTYLGLQKIQEAEQLLRETLPALDRVLGKRHEYSMRSLSHLASVYEQQSRWKDAEPHEAELLQRRKDFLGSNHPSTLTSMKSLSILYQRQRRWQEAQKLDDSVQQLSSAKGLLAPPSGSRGVSSRTNDDAAYFTATESTSTSSVEEIVTTAVSRVLGAKHPESIESMEEEAIARLDQQRWAQAETILTRILSRRREVQGETHLFTIQTLSNLGWAYQGQGKFENAIAAFHEALENLKQNQSITDTRFQTQIEHRLAVTNRRLQSPEEPISGALGLDNTSSGSGSGKTGSRPLITSNMTREEIMAYLTNRSCPDISQTLDESRCTNNGSSRDGGFGMVWKGMLLDGTIVALKRVQNSPKPLKYLARELYTWSKARHNHVLELLGMAYLRGDLLMVSPWMEFGSVSEYLKEHPGVSRLRTAILVAEGVAYLHRVPLVHGDIKATNVFVSRDGVVKIGDFGMAVFLGEQSVEFSSTDGGKGTQRFMAPELFTDSGSHSSPESDVYALGMTILEILTGKMPFPEIAQGMRVAMVVCYQGQRPSYPNEIRSMGERGAKLWRLLNRCWDAKPSERPTSEEVWQEMKALE